MLTKRMSRGAAQVIASLSSAGYQAYLVGGCVRDMLMSKEVNDYDIATSALPHEVMKIFPKTIPTGVKHGTVTVLIGEEKFEVTTFRSEGEYIDGRHPSSVSFQKDIIFDLARRDFTINAMAMTAQGDVIDPFEGRKDLERRLIRCVGKPEERFSEDALRMFRCIRFAAVLDFEIEEKTMAALSQFGHIAVNISAERVRDELEKLLMSSRPELFETAVKTGMVKCTGTEAGTQWGRLSLMPHDRLCRWAGACVLLGVNDVDRLRLEKKLRAPIKTAFSIYKNALENAVDIKTAVSRTGYDAVKAASAMRFALGDEKSLSNCKAVFDSGECCTIDDLAVSGKDLEDLGIEQGKRIGEILQALLCEVIKDSSRNKKSTLLDMVAKMLTDTFSLE